MKERTNFIHDCHIVHVVSLPQVEGQLSGKKERKQCFFIFIIVCEVRHV